MRYLILAFSILFFLPLHGQRKKNKKSEHILHVRGGFISDFKTDESELNYNGFNVLNFGWSKVKGNQLHGIEVEGFSFTEGFVEFIVTNMDTIITRGLDRNRTTVELIYSRMYALNNNDITKGLFVGPTGSILYNRDENIPAVTTAFPIATDCFCIGLGARAGYNWRLLDRLMITFSTKATLLDIGWKRERVLNPILTKSQKIAEEGVNADFIRPQYQIMLGLNFRI